jgi:hypothetical protein
MRWLSRLINPFLKDSWDSMPVSVAIDCMNSGWGQARSAIAVSRGSPVPYIQCHLDTYICESRLVDGVALDEMNGEEQS